MIRKVFVGMIRNAMMVFTRKILRINVDGNIGKIVQIMEQPMSDIQRDSMSAGDRHTGVYGKVYFGMEAMTQPAHPHICNTVHSPNVLRRLFDLVHQLRVNSI